MNSKKKLSGRQNVELIEAPCVVIEHRRLQISGAATFFTHVFVTKHPHLEPGNLNQKRNTQIHEQFESQQKDVCRRYARQKRFGVAGNRTQNLLHSVMLKEQC